MENKTHNVELQNQNLSNDRFGIIALNKKEKMSKKAYAEQCSYGALYIKSLLCSKKNCLKLE